MLFGLAAVAIPIIIQILTRKNASRIKWGAWLFLDATMKKRKRKVLLEDILGRAVLGIGFAGIGIRASFRKTGFAGAMGSYYASVVTGYYPHRHIICALALS